jgi:hypothetical protein
VPAAAGVNSIVVGAGREDEKVAEAVVKTILDVKEAQPGHPRCSCDDAEKQRGTDVYKSRGMIRERKVT